MAQGTKVRTFESFIFVPPYPSLLVYSYSSSQLSFFIPLSIIDHYIRAQYTIRICLARTARTRAPLGARVNLHPAHLASLVALLLLNVNGRRHSGRRNNGAPNGRAVPRLTLKGHRRATKARRPRLAATSRRKKLVFSLKRTVSDGNSGRLIAATDRRAGSRIVARRLS